MQILVTVNLYKVLLVIANNIVDIFYVHEILHLI